MDYAGIGAQGTVEDASDEEWRSVLDMNVVGTARVCRAAWPALRASFHAVVVNTCSVAATAGLLAAGYATVQATLDPALSQLAVGRAAVLGGSAAHWYRTSA